MFEASLHILSQHGFLLGLDYENGIITHKTEPISRRFYKLEIGLIFFKLQLLWTSKDIKEGAL